MKRILQLICVGFAALFILGAVFADYVSGSWLTGGEAAAIRGNFGVCAIVALALYATVTMTIRTFTLMGLAMLGAAALIMLAPAPGLDTSSLTQGQFVGILVAMSALMLVGSFFASITSPRRSAAA